MCGQCLVKSQTKAQSSGTGNFREQLPSWRSREKGEDLEPRVSTMWRNLFDRAVTLSEEYSQLVMIPQGKRGRNIYPNLSLLSLWLPATAPHWPNETGSCKSRKPLKAVIKVSLEGVGGKWRRLERGIWWAKQKTASVISHSVLWIELIFYCSPQYPPLSITPYTKAKYHSPFIIMLALCCFL